MFVDPTACHEHSVFPTLLELFWGREAPSKSLPWLTGGDQTCRLGHTVYMGCCVFWALSFLGRLCFVSFINPLGTGRRNDQKERSAYGQS